MKQKKLLLPVIGFFLLLMQLNIHAQEYHPFPEENAFWTVFEFDQQIWAWETYIYTIKGDTALNAKDYKKIYRLNDIPNSSDTLWKLHSFMRQEPENKKVWFIRHYMDETTEKLCYDFNAQIGDTVYLPAFDYENIGDSVFVLINPGDDSTLLHNGEYRKNYFYGSIYPGIDLDPYVIEGVGTQRTPFPNLLYFDASHQSMLSCLMVNGVHLYGGTVPYTYCDFTVNLDENTPNYNFTVKPNPCNNYLLITLPDNLTEDANLQLVNIYGTIVHCEKIQCIKKEYKINTIALANGIYFLRLQTNTNKNTSIKVIINN